MKKILTFAAIFALVTAVSAKAVSAVTFAPVQVGVVEGLVIKPDNTAAVGANVNVVCNGTPLSTTTDASGFYFVQYGNGVCVAGQTVTVDATLGSLHGSKSGTMSAEGYNTYVKLDVAIVNVPMVPEFGLITGALALVTSAGSMVILRKRTV
jgi:hypothetical protein